MSSHLVQVRLQAMIIPAEVANESRAIAETASVFKNAQCVVSGCSLLCYGFRRYNTAAVNY